jgi:hypothetical protein
MEIDGEMGVSSVGHSVILTKVFWNIYRNSGEIEEIDEIDILISSKRQVFVYK